MASTRAADLEPRSARAVTSGAIVWILAVQFFVAQVIVQWAWTTPYSLTANFISDLGNTACGEYPVGSNNYVCSPWHGAMNASFVLLGVIILVGAALTQRTFPSGRVRTVGLGLLTLAGLGEVLVGVFPENVAITSHAIGAGAHFIGGNIAIALLGAALPGRRRTRLAVYSVISGALGLVATALFVSGIYLGAGIGGMERIAAYPLPLWLIIVGVALRRLA